MKLGTVISDVFLKKGFSSSWRIVGLWSSDVWTTKQGFYCLVCNADDPTARIELVIIYDGQRHRVVRTRLLHHGRILFLQEVL